MSNWLHAVDGKFNRKHNWSPHTVPGPTDDAILDAAGAAFTVTATTDEDVNSIQTASNATLFLKGDPNTAHTFTLENGTGNGVNAGVIKVGDNVTLQVLAQVGKDETYFVNSGMISLNAKTGNSFLEMQSYNAGGGGFVRLSGGGSIVMSDSALNGIVDTYVTPNEGAFLDNVDNTISGAGVIGNGGLGNGIELTIENAAAGVIDATGALNPLIISAPSKYGFTNLFNEGLVEGTGKAGLNIAATTVDNQDGTIFAGDGSIVRLESSTIKGGTFSTAGSGVVLVSGGSSIDGSASAVANTGVLQDFGETMYAQGAITNSGAIRLSDETTGAILQVGAAGLTLSGGGTVTLTDNFQNGIQGNGAPSTLTNIDNTISGAGTLGGGQLSLVNASKGVIDATGAFNPLIVSASTVNSGLMEATGAGGLDLAAITVDGSGGGIISAAAGSIVRLESASLVGGTLQVAAKAQVEASGGSSLSGTAVTNQGLFTVVEADTLSVDGSIANGGTVSLAGTSSGAHLLLTGALVLSGGGKVLLGNGGSIDSAAAGDTFTNVDNLIIGDGELGGGATKLTNMAGGVIHETGTGGLLIDAVTTINAGRIEAGGAGDISVLSKVTNSGMLEADKGSMLSLTAAVKNSGVLEANGGTLIAFQAVTGTGSAVISGGTLEFVKTFNQNVAFTGKSGTLDLAKSQSYTQTVTGFSATGGTAFDLGDIKFVDASEATFSGDAAGGTLTVTDGTHIAHIALSGDYTGATFTASKDGNGGVIVKASTGAASAPPHAFIAAMAGLGAGAGGPAPVASEAHFARPAMLAVPRMAMA